MSFVDNIMAGFSLVANLESFLALLVGITIGTVAGAIPGLSATMAVALTLPFTFSMTPITGILLLLGVYKGGIFGGSIPAILIKTPGTPASSATILDGYPLAEKGQAGKALGMALWASCTADLISNLALILFAGWLASFALNFGPPEFFTLILFSLTIIAGVSGESLLRGALSAMFGLLLATVGLDLIYGTQRFTFENPNMMGGLNFIAVLITSCANEMKRLLHSLDPNERTILQPAYLGDLLVTCYSPHSRNRSLGLLIGKGYSVENAIEKMTMVAEGYHATSSIYNRVTSLKIKNQTPIITSTYGILYKEQDAKTQLKKLELLIS